MPTMRPMRCARSKVTWPSSALNAGLVTQLDGRFRVEDRLAEITGEDEDAHSLQGHRSSSYMAHVRSTEALASRPVDKVAVIVASGEIVPGEQQPGTIGSDTLAGQLRDARFDESVKAVVLRIDSPAAVRSRARSSAAKSTS